MDCKPFFTALVRVLQRSRTKKGFCVREREIERGREGESERKVENT